MSAPALFAVAVLVPPVVVPQSSRAAGLNVVEKSFAELGGH